MKKPLAIWSPRPDADTVTTLTANINIYGLPLMTIHLKTLSELSLQQVTTTDTLLFTSRYAVIHSIAQLPPNAFTDKTLIAIGQRTAETLTAAGLSTKLTAPPPFTSESLLADPQFQTYHYQQLAIICGVGGRKHLQTQLSTGTKPVHRIECYQRDKANVSPQVMVEFLCKHAIGGIIVSSCEIAEAVTSMLSKIGEQHNDHWTFFAFSKRIAAQLRKAGYTRIIVSDAANQHRLNQCIINWWEGSDNG